MAMHLYNGNNMASAETIFAKFINSIFIFVNDQNCNIKLLTFFSQVSCVHVAIF